jgi:hypothetical protein
VRSVKSDKAIKSKFKQIVSIKLSLCTKLNTVKKPGITATVRECDTVRQCPRASTGRAHNLMEVKDTLKKIATEEGLRGNSSKKDLLEELLAERENRASMWAGTRYTVGWLSHPYVYSVAVCAQTTYEYGKLP